MYNVKKRCQLDLRGFFFSERVIDKWNNSQQCTIDSTSINCASRIGTRTYTSYMDGLLYGLAGPPGPMTSHALWICLRSRCGCGSTWQPGRLMLCYWVILVCFGIEYNSILPITALHSVGWVGCLYGALAKMALFGKVCVSLPQTWYKSVFNRMQYACVFLFPLLYSITFMNFVVFLFVILD